MACDINPDDQDYRTSDERIQDEFEEIKARICELECQLDKLRQEEKQSD